MFNQAEIIFFRNKDKYYDINFYISLIWTFFFHLRKKSTKQNNEKRGLQYLPNQILNWLLKSKIFEKKKRTLIASSFCDKAEDPLEIK